MLVCVAAALASAGEVEQRTGLSRRLAEMATAARGILPLGIDDRTNTRHGCAHRSTDSRPGRQVEGLAGVDVDARGADRVVKQHLAEKAFCLRCLITRIHGSIWHPRHGNVSVGCWDFEFVDAANLLVNE